MKHQDGSQTKRLERQMNQNNTMIGIYSAEWITGIDKVTVDLCKSSRCHALTLLRDEKPSF